MELIIYGVDECPSGMAKAAHLESDLSNVISVLPMVDSSIQPQSIKDCFGLGKFSTNKLRSRPLLVQFVRFSDVYTILSKRGKLSSPYSIKPDMSQEQ